MSVALVDVLIVNPLTVLYFDEKNKCPIFLPYFVTTSLYADSKLLKQVNLALTLKTVKENRNVLSLTENELIDMIENILALEIKARDTYKKDMELFETEKDLHRHLKTECKSILIQCDTCLNKLTRLDMHDEEVHSCSKQLKI